MKTFYIYLITQNNIPIYVGATQDVKRRFKAHKLTTFKDNNEMLLYEVLEECTEDNVSKQEIYWIGYYKNKGHHLLNKSFGGYSFLNKDGVEMETLKLDAVLVSKVRDIKKETGITISQFIEQAIEEKLIKSKTREV